MRPDYIADATCSVSNYCEWVPVEPPFEHCRKCGIERPRYVQDRTRSIEVVACGKGGNCEWIHRVYPNKVLDLVEQALQCVVGAIELVDKSRGADFTYEVPDRRVELECARTLLELVQQLERRQSQAETEGRAQ